MSGAPKLRSMNVTESDSRPVLGPTGNKTRLTSVSRKPASKPLREAERAQSGLKEEKKEVSMVTDSQSFSPPMSPVAVPRRQKLLLQSSFSLNASCSSDASTDSFCSRASTGRIGRLNFTSKRRQSIPKPEKIVSREEIVADGAVVAAMETLQMKKRCAWVTPNTDSAYVTFHDEEWGVPVHDDKKLFELLVLSGALAEFTWPAILNKRQIFREIFMNFDPVLVSKMNGKKLIAQGSIASSLLSETKLRAVIENGQLILKIIEEFGSFDNYCWSFVNHKPIASRFRYPRQIPVKTPKADSISKDLVRRGFRGVGPTVMYSFMQAAGLTNDHLINCFRFEECCESVSLKAEASSERLNPGEELKDDIVLDLVRDAEAYRRTLKNCLVLKKKRRLCDEAGFCFTLFNESWIMGSPLKEIMRTNEYSSEENL
ncbi:uncharacterized protein LOC110094432 isoform X2 [Dendrobium catenatum]|uniref:uncharacterized protein LOC110094432 isoform X2 n=1 Tax=Dendrobium catenatum TaxID=906689 RepID=UPI00109F06DE|nr:uncharacterized protein LOC110094432 isoform X2 [Dendrobium catenatum]